MGMVISAASTHARAAGDTATTAGLAGRAARDCLTRAGLAPSAIGVLVNVSVYRESNTFEPALAALVQKEIGIGPDYLCEPVPAFSFDLMNGACGVLNAVQIGQAVLDTGSTDRLLVTAADVHPCGDADRDPDYPYADLAGALLLEHSADPEAGFGPVRHYTAGGPSDIEGYLDTRAVGAEGRSRITVRRTDGYGRRLADLAAASVTAYAHAHGIDLDRTLVIGPRTAADAMGPGTGADTGEPHTAAPVVGYLRAMAAGRPADCDQLLFVTVGAGPSASCATYRPEGW